MGGGGLHVPHQADLETIRKVLNELLVIIHFVNFQNSQAMNYSKGKASQPERGGRAPPPHVPSPAAAARLAAAPEDVSPPGAASRGGAKV